MNVDRSKAQQVGLTQRDVATSMLISLSGSQQTAPNQWLNPENGVNYQVSVQTPPYKMDSIDTIQRTPITSTTTNATQLLGNLASVKRNIATTIVNHYNVQPVFDILADVDRRDQGSVAKEIQKIMDEQSKHLPRGSFLQLQGQVQTMRTSFTRLTLGMLFAVIFVYLLMAVNFQSWTDPFIILTALPGVFVGILWMLFMTQTTFSVPSLMGAIMSIGVATANSILMVTFANDERIAVPAARDAMLSAGYARIRPVLREPPGKKRLQGDQDGRGEEEPGHYPREDRSTEREEEPGPEDAPQRRIRTQAIQRRLRVRGRRR